MPSDDRAATRNLDEDVTRVRLASAKRVDPAADERSIRRFWDEISEAEAALGTMDAAAAPLPVAFTAGWPDQDPA